MKLGFIVAICFIIWSAPAAAGQALQEAFLPLPECVKNVIRYEGSSQWAIVAQFPASYVGACNQMFAWMERHGYQKEQEVKQRQIAIILWKKNNDKVLMQLSALSPCLTELKMGIIK